MNPFCMRLLVNLIHFGMCNHKQNNDNNCFFFFTTSSRNMAWSPGPSRYPEVESEYELFETLGSGISNW